MFQNIFANLQKVGKSLMLPVSVLPIAGILLGIGSAHFSLIPEFISKIMLETGGSIFSNMPLIFSIGVSLGFTKNDGVAALASVISYNIMIKTSDIMSPFFSNYSFLITDESIKKIHDTGIVGGILSGTVSAFLFNKFHKIQLPEYLGFFAGKRFIPIISGLSSIILGLILSFIWPPIGYIIKKFSMWSAYQNPIIAFGIYGFVERALVPFGLHHIWNVPFQMQIGEFKNHMGQIFHGDIARYMAGDTSAGKLAGGFIFKMFGLPGAALAIWNCSKKENKAKVGGIMISAALTAFLTGITEPIEFTFLFISPLLYFIHSILAGLSFSICIFLNMRAGTSFSHGLVDFILLSGNSNKLWLFPIIGIFYTFLYYLLFYTFITKYNLKTIGREEEILTNSDENINYKIPKIIKYLGGKKNILNLDACITRLRITVYNSSKVNVKKIKLLGASGVFVSGSGIQIVFGTQSDNIKTLIDNYIK
ncbi:MAG: PTS glucose transporter subunit IIBC [Buchnera aphidicola (Periphyllus aceris)]|nr:PTS glucose transporter subunit IIBC [Buchnera aphidicola (Periphyllus aceris)]